MKLFRIAFLLLCGAASGTPFFSFAQPVKDNEKVLITDQWNALTGAEQWHQVAAVPLQFATYHTQGLTKVREHFFLTAVKVTRWPKKFDHPVNGFDRDQGEGQGFLFKFNQKGQLIDSLLLGEGSIYHPGGIDFDGQSIWVPVCEYRPGGPSIVYRVNPTTLKAEKMAELPDALGAVAMNRQRQELVGMNWGSRKCYTWTLDATTGDLHLQNAVGSLNPHYYVDYQDCTYADNGQMLCAGLKTYKNATGQDLRLGGIELLHMQTLVAGRQLPVNIYTPKGVLLTNNPFFVDLNVGTLQFYFIPEDDRSVLYIYQLQQNR